MTTLMYWREYRAQFHIAHTYSVSEATVSRTIREIEDVLIRSKQFPLLGKKALWPSDTVIEVVIVDATEQPIERPKKSSVGNYSGKKKRHTQKAQVIVHRQSKIIIATAFGQGRMHDFHLFKQSRVRFAAKTLCLADKGYLGIAKFTR